MLNRIKNIRGIVVLIYLLLGVVTLTTYWPLLKSGFIDLDDPQYVTNNPGVLGGLTLRKVEWALFTNHASNWHPLTWMSHQLDVQLFGRQAGWHHFTSLVFHIANTMLLFGLLRQMTGSLWRSTLVAALFALHPLHVESVAWVAERKDVLSTFFLLLTIGAYAKYARCIEGFPAQRFRLRGLMFYAAALVFFALGLMSKAMLVTLPFLLLLLDYWPLERTSKKGTEESGPSSKRFQNADRPMPRLLLEKIPFFALSAGSCLITFLVQDRAHAVSVGVPLEARFANAISAYLNYLVKTIWPTHLAVFYPHPFMSSAMQDLWGPEVYGAVLVILGLSSWALWRRKREPWFTVGWFWYLGTLVPVIGIVQVGAQAMADRYTYIPLIGIFIAGVWAAAEFLGRRLEFGSSKSEANTAPFAWMRRALPGAFGIVVIATCAGMTRNQVKYWHDDLTLFKHALAVTKHNALAHCNLGSDYTKLGQDSEAEAHYRAALEEAPGFVEAYLGLGAILDAQGKKEEALEQFQAAVRSKPWNAVARSCLGSMFLHLGRNEEALAEFTEAIRLEPFLCDAQSNLGRALAGLGKLEEALAQFDAAVSCDPNSERAHFGRGNILSQLHHHEQAVLEYQTVLHLNPTNSGAMNDLAWIRAAAADVKLRDGAEAVRFAEQACKLTQFHEPQLIGTLAAAYAEAGRFEEAIETGEKAKGLALAAGSRMLADKNEGLLKFYRNRRPYHEPELRP